MLYNAPVIVIMSLSTGKASLSKRAYYALAVLVILLAAALRLWQLNTLPLGVRPDEIHSLTLVDRIRAGQTGIGIFYPVPESEAVREGLYYTLLTVVTFLTGNGVLGTRIISAWAGILTVALIYTLGVRLYGRLAGLAAMLCMAVMGVALFLSRTILVNALLPLYATALLLALARAFPVYRGARDAGTTTSAYAAVGVLLGMGLYLHPISLLMVLASMVFIVFLLLAAPDKRPRLGDVGFSILLIMILSVPYIITSINRPVFAASSRIIGGYGSMIMSTINTLNGVMLRGDMNPAHNLPGRPLVDLVSGLFIIIGLLVCLWGWRTARFAMILITLIFVMPGVILTADAPNFLSFAPILPIVALLFGLGVSTLAENTPRTTRPVVYVGVAGVVLFSLIWTVRDTFIIWPAREDVQALYHTDAGALAHYLDRTAGTTPTALCDISYEADTPANEYSAARLVQRLMNRKTAPLRVFNCRNSLVFINGGATQQIVVADPSARGTLPPLIQGWIDLATPITDMGVPAGSVVQLESATVLADQLGAFITTTPAVLLSNRSEVVAAPPIRLGQNVTWLGYQSSTSLYQPGESLSVVTYWRAEGPVPMDLRLFVHLLSDPSTIVRQRDVLYVDPMRLQDRDVWFNITEIPLPRTILPGEYRVSIGAYERRSGTRLLVTGDQLPAVDRLLLYPIQIITP